VCHQSDWTVRHLSGGGDDDDDDDVPDDIHCPDHLPLTTLYQPTSVATVQQT